MHASAIELRILRDSSYVLTCFAEGYFGDSKKSLSELIESMELPEASGSPLSRFLEETRAVYQGIRSGDDARRAAVQRFCQIDNAMWQLILERQRNEEQRPTKVEPQASAPRQWLMTIWKALDKPHILLSALWLGAAIAFATYEVHTLPYKSTGWLFSFAGYGLGYPRPIGWIFVASVLAVIWILPSGRLNGPDSVVPRLALVLAITVAAVIPAWQIYTPKTRADCYLTYIKAGMSDQAVRDIRSACQEKYP